MEQYYSLYKRLIVQITTKNEIGTESEKKRPWLGTRKTENIATQKQTVLEKKITNTGLHNEKKMAEI